MSEIVRGRYLHYKGREYEVTGLARHSETEEEFVVYRPLYNSEQNGEHRYWVRPVAMFTENVLVDGQEKPRFALIEAY
jgi:hypothetical protein